MNDPASRFSDLSFWNKVRQVGHRAGFRTIETALLLFYTATAPGTPVWCKGVLLGALGYFISLLDAVPDLTPVLGYTDDLSVMLAALATVASHITPALRDKAHQQALRLLGPQKPAAKKD